MEKVILVDSHDKEIGVMEKMKAHQEGALHRAFSVLLFNSNGELLLQKRASTKYHSGGLWSNTCCSHPKPNEDNLDAVRRRLKEEIGITADPSFLYNFIYKYQFDNKLIEHELDHVYIGETDSDPIINPNEVEEWKWISWENLIKDIHTNEGKYSFWFKRIIHQLIHSSLLPEKFRPKSN